MSTQASILSRLKNRIGQWVSGEELSAGLSISRSAVWKHIRGLREADYVIDSLPRKGYRLRRASEHLLPDEIRDRLHTRVMGRGGIHTFPLADSTNTLAKDLADHGALEGTIVLAETQTGGRGRKGRSWFSPEREGIYLSLILRPDISPFEVQGITLLSAVALTDSLGRRTSLKAAIKWPNDVFVGSRKIAGILTETSSEMDITNYVVVGLGVNVNTRRFPEPLDRSATSLFLETGRHFSRVELLRDFLEEFETLYLSAQSRGFAGVFDRWRSLTNTIGRRVRITMHQGSRSGIVRDIDTDGALMITDDQGRTSRILSGDLSFE
ncbi:MAG: biotin--[acetyl-CoA-carboxylase] ligase [Thermodesulfobacteriota bacterium]